MGTASYHGKTGWTTRSVVVRRVLRRTIRNPPQQGTGSSPSAEALPAAAVTAILVPAASFAGQLYLRLARWLRGRGQGCPGRRSRRWLSPAQAPALDPHGTRHVEVRDSVAAGLRGLLRSGHLAVRPDVHRQKAGREVLDQALAPLDECDRRREIRVQVQV